MPLQCNGAEFAVYVNTAQEADGSDSGARPDEAVTWGKIKMDAKPVKVFLKNVSAWIKIPLCSTLFVYSLFLLSFQVVADATLVFPLLVAETFAVNANKQ